MYNMYVYTCTRYIYCVHCVVNALCAIQTELLAMKHLPLSQKKPESLNGKFFRYWQYMYVHVVDIHVYDMFMYMHVCPKGVWKR